MHGVTPDAPVADLECETLAAPVLRVSDVPELERSQLAAGDSPLLFILTGVRLL